jgi:bifunctional non-homologous end joining protein LigD
MALTEYKRKRDFGKTAEPAGGKPLPKTVKGASHFVIQKHDASRLHYDFRLEMDGVLKSWAIPKGLPWQQGEKHLAVEVEDHPVEYATFEGIIPQGQYGGGTVMVWDRGKYYVYGEDPLKSLKDGKLHLVLDGEKAKGEWTLVRIRSSDEKNQWLILKTGGSLKPLSKKLDDQSAKSGRTMQQIAEDQDAEWESNRKDESPTRSFRDRIRSAIRGGQKKTAGAASKSQRSQRPKKKDTRELERDGAGSNRTSARPIGREAASANRVDLSPGEPRRPKHGSGISLPDSLPSAKPRFIEPMKPRLVDNPPTTGDWIYELKFDGIRACAIKDGSKISLISRNGNDLRSRFPEIVEAMKQFAVEECVIDGEVVALDEEGRSSFQLLQALEMEGRKSPICFYVFDLLQLNGKSLLQLLLMQRKELLAKICEDVEDPIRYSGEIGTYAKPLLAEVSRRGLEGLIGKLRNSVYEPNRRSGAWIKLKCVHEQEFVIGGYTPPSGSRKYFGAILVGYYEDGRLKFAGKVGSGFTSKSLAILYKKFREEERADCSFVDLPSKQGGQWVQGLTPSMMTKMHWINPEFVAQIKFSEWTRDGKLRQPVFLGLREDKPAGEVTRES